jgi:hypothetical protein
VKLTAPALSATPASKTATSITLTPPAASAQDVSAAVQYGSKPTSGDEWGAWQTSPEFTGLVPDTSYDFQAKYTAATASWSDSDASATATISTDAQAQEPADPESATYSYTISPGVNSLSAAVGDKIAVSVTVTADKPEATFAALDATLNFDSSKVSFVGAEFKPAWTSGEATSGGKIAGYGESADVGGGAVVAEYTFTAQAAGAAEFSIASGAKIGVSGSAADISASSGASVTVNISAPSEVALIGRASFMSAPRGYQAIRYVADALPSAGSAYYYGEDTTPLLYAGWSDAGYVFVGFIADSVQSADVGAITQKTGSYETVSYDGDVNGSDITNAIDALVVYDITSEGYYADDTGFETLSRLDRMEADFNKDGVVNAADARAILYASLGMSDPAA